MSDIIIGVALWHLSPRVLAGCIGSGHRSGHSEREIMGRLAVGRRQEGSPGRAGQQSVQTGEPLPASSYITATTTNQPRLPPDSQ